MEISLEELKSLPKGPGVYLFLDKENKVIYIGKAINLSQRIRSYFQKNLDFKTKSLVSQIAKINYIKVFSEFEGLLLEAALIKKFQPKYNVRLKDDKSFLYIAITEEEFPKVLSVRKNDIANPKYLFGPFPSAKTVRQVLTFLRKIFPYCSQKGNSKPCFWSHLGLCQPCPGEISKLTGEERKRKRQDYLTNIKHLVTVLSGKSRKLIRNLTAQMEEAAKQKDYEKAAHFQAQIKKLTWLTGPHFPISFYLEKPSFFEEEQEKELNDLRQILSLPSLERIEGYDVSNIAGLYASGSMVVFYEGIASKDHYRRFRIKISGKPNDVAMISEILRRRLKHQEWDYPQLIIVDGGKPQVSACVNVLKQLNIKIAVIGLAKRLEQIVLAENGRWDIKQLPPNSPALDLLKRIRDEAHRFALSYHRKLRSVV